MRIHDVMRYYHPFPEAIPLSEAGCSRVTHPSATKLRSKLLNSVRLACVRRAASVRPEPGSNSLVFVYPPVFTGKHLELFSSLLCPNANIVMLLFIQN